MENLRLLVADDHEIVRKGVRRLLTDRPGWEVVGEAADGREAIEQATLLRPDITILDLMMPHVNGLEAAREILKSVPTKILILTVYGSDSLIQQTLQIGAQGYVFKSDAGRDLILAVDALRRNKTFFTPIVEDLLLEGFLESTPKKKKPDCLDRSHLRLTSRQTAILRMLVEGKSSRDIGTALNISAKTAETHRANIMRRLRCHSVTDLVRYAVRNHLIEP